MRSAFQPVLQFDQEATDNLSRVRKRSFPFKFPALNYELRSGILLLLMLNALILLVNLLDIYWVWFNFEWEGQYLKQFVHEGTYLLILSIFISIALVLFFFRGNMNFYKKKQVVKIVISQLVNSEWNFNHFSCHSKHVVHTSFFIGI